MALGDDVLAEVNEILGARMSVVDGRSIPDLSAVPFGSSGKRIRLHALFVDIRKSTAIVDTLGLLDSAKVYKAYLRAVTRIVRDRGGEVLSFNGDGIVAGFVGASAANAAVLCGLNLNWLCNQLLKPPIDSALANAGAELAFEWGIGVDAGDVLVVKGGMRGDANSDLVWAGTPVNHAVKISSQSSYPHTLIVSDAVYRPLAEQLRQTATLVPVFERLDWAEKARVLWRSSWWFAPGAVPAVPQPVRTPLPEAPRTLLDFLRSMKPQAPPPSGATMRDIIQGFDRRR